MQVITHGRWAAVVAAIGGMMVIAPITAAEQPSSLAPKWTPWVEFGGFYGSDETSRGEGVVWAPFAQGQTSLVFGEARGKIFEHDMREGNFALGYRQMMAGGWNLGFWGGYDIRRSTFGNNFHQLAGGIELLSDRWDFRANAYLPLNDKENVGTSSTPFTSSIVDVTGPNIGLITTSGILSDSLDEVALWGFDAEIGTKLFATPDDLPGPRHELRVYAGAFHFDHSDLAQSVTGPRLRAEWRVDNLVDQWRGSRLTLEAEYSHDKLRDDRVEVGARLRLPFGDSGAGSAHRLSAQERRMAEGLERDTDIVTNAKATSTTSGTTVINEAAEDAETGVRFDRVVTIDATSDLNTTSSTAGANSLIIADGNAGDFVGNHTIQGDQTLMGGGSTIQLRGATSGVVVDFTAAGSRANVTSTSGQTVTIGGDNVHIANIDASSSGFILGDYAVYMASQSNTVITGLNITGGYDGFHMAGSGGSARIQDTTISGALDDAIQIAGDNQSLNVRNSELRDSGFGVYLTAINSTLDFDNIRIANITSVLLLLSSGTGNTLALNNSDLVGPFSQWPIQIAGGLVISGTNNTATPAPAMEMCLSSGAWSGSFEVNGTTYTAADCAP